MGPDIYNSPVPLQWVGENTRVELMFQRYCGIKLKLPSKNFSLRLPLCVASSLSLSWGPHSLPSSLGSTCWIKTCTWILTSGSASGEANRRQLPWELFPKQYILNFLKLSLINYLFNIQNMPGDCNVIQTEIFLFWRHFDFRTWGILFQIRLLLQENMHFQFCLYRSIVKENESLWTCKFWSILSYDKIMRK